MVGDAVLWKLVENRDGLAMITAGRSQRRDSVSTASIDGTLKSPPVPTVEVKV